MEAINHLTPVLRAQDQCNARIRATKIRAGVDLRFLETKETISFPMRLAREISDALSDIRQNPLAFIASITATGQIGHDRKKRFRIGIIAAVAFYAFALSGIYLVYVMFHHQQQTRIAPAPHLNITFVATPPMPINKRVPVLKEASVATKKDLLTVPTPPSAQAKVLLPEAKPTPPPPELTKTEATAAPPAPYPPTNQTASRVSASDEARGLQGSGVGEASGSGRGNSSNSGVNAARVNYNDVLTVSNVTTRPQILARPVPGYTDEARRAQVEGAVKLSVVLKADGTVSDITVARTLGYGLDQKAIEAAKELRFVPAQKDGHTVSVRIFLEFKFSLL
jgi:TonB family protein